MMAKKKNKAFSRKVRLDPRPVVATLLASAVAATVWFAYTAPQRSEADAAKTAYTEAYDELTVKENSLDALRSGERSAAGELLTQVVKLDQLLPEQADSIILLAQIESLGQSSGVTVTAITPGQSKSSGAGVEIPYLITITGSLDNVLGFSQNVQNASPMMRINSFALTPGSATTDGAPPAASTEGSAAGINRSAVSAQLSLSVYSSKDPIFKPE